MCYVAIIMLSLQIIEGHVMGITVILDDPAGNSYLQVRVTHNVHIMEEVHVIHVCVPCLRP